MALGFGSQLFCDVHHRILSESRFRGSTLSILLTVRAESVIGTEVA